MIRLRPVSVCSYRTCPPTHLAGRQVVMPGACRGAANQSQRRAVCRPPDAPLRPTRSWCPAQRRRRPGWRVQRPAVFPPSVPAAATSSRTSQRTGSGGSGASRAPAVRQRRRMGCRCCHRQPTGGFHRRSKVTATTGTGALGRPVPAHSVDPPEEDQVGEHRIGNGPYRCASRNASVPPCGSTCPATDSTSSNSRCAYPLAQRSPDQAVSPYSTIIQRSYSRSLPRTGTKRLPASRAVARSDAIGQAASNRLRA